MSAASEGLSIYLPGGVVLPHALEEALRESQFVVFVGAGASVDPPSGLPVFRDMTAEILGLAGSTDAPDVDGRFDVQLGDLADAGFDVHGAVRHVLDRPGSEPNRWHKSIALLFDDATNARIVTTNYDLHLEAAIGASGIVLSAPALPLGDSFHGVVHLHGSLNGEREGLVVTDADFGRAYLTQGWARRFLVSLFQRFIVLFVGYSANDVVLSYLARGLPPSDAPRWFALVRPDEDVAKWERLRIDPIRWEADATDEYGPPVLALRELGTQTKRTNLQHEAAIKALAEAGPPLDPVSDSYLIRCLHDPIRVQSFGRAAPHHLWLDWLQGRTAFDALFKSASQLGEAQVHLAQWFAKYVVENPIESLNTFSRMGSKFSRGLWVAVADAIWRSSGIAASGLSGWVTLLCNHHQGADDTLLNYLFEKCRLPEDRNSLIELLDTLFHPRLSLRPGINIPGVQHRADLEITCAADRHWIEKVISETIIPNVDMIAEDLFGLATARLAEYHKLYESFGLTPGAHDSISVLRAAIEPTDQDRFNATPMLMVDVAREAAKAMTVQRGLLPVVDDLMRREVPILSRLAAWLVAEA